MKKKKRWFRLSIKAALLMVVVFSIFLALLIYRVERQRAAIRWVVQNGGEVRYDFEVELDESQGWIVTKDGAKPPGPDWLRNLLGIDFFESPKYVAIWNNKDVKSIEKIVCLTNVKYLDLGNSGVESIEGIEKLKKLELLDLSNTRVKGISGVEKLKSLKFLRLEGTLVSDLTPCYDHQTLEYLVVRDTNIRNVRFLAALPKIRYIELDDSVSQEDVEYLAESLEFCDIF